MDERLNWYGQMGSRNIMAATRKGKVSHFILTSPSDDLINTEYASLCDDDVNRKLGWKWNTCLPICEDCQKAFESFLRREAV